MNEIYTFQFLQGISYGPDLSAPKVMSFLLFLFCISFGVSRLVMWLCKEMFCTSIPIVSKFPCLPKQFKCLHQQFLYPCPSISSFFFNIWSLACFFQFSSPEFFHLMSGTTTMMWTDIFSEKLESQTIATACFRCASSKKAQDYIPTIVLSSGHQPQTAL